MKVRLSDIPADGLTFKDTLPLDAINARMDEGQGNDIYFKSAPQVEVTVYKSRKGSEIKGWVRATCLQPCGRCLVKIENELKVSADFILKPSDEKSPNDDLGVVYYEGEHIDLEDILQETLILALDPYMQPDTDENGKCKLCNKNVLEEFSDREKDSNSLGKLLKDAGVKKH